MNSERVDRFEWIPALRSLRLLRFTPVRREALAAVAAARRLPKKVDAAKVLSFTAITDKLELFGHRHRFRIAGEFLEDNILGAKSGQQFIRDRRLVGDAIRELADRALKHIANEAPVTELLRPLTMKKCESAQKSLLSRRFRNIVVPVAHRLENQSQLPG
jgi:hypothetical protein